MSRSLCLLGATLLTLLVVAAPPAGSCRRDTAQAGEAQQPADERSALPENDPRRGAEITLVLDKKTFFLGENVLLHYHVCNRGKEPFSVSFGCDCDACAGRALRFKVEATDVEGRLAEDPFRSDFGAGLGFGSESTLKPGGEFWDVVPLMKYREPGAAGTYTVRVYHDLGWEQTKGRALPENLSTGDIPKGPHNAPTLATTIRFVMPDPQQARQVVEAMLKLPSDPDRVVGERCRPFADFETLRYPVYLPVVKELVEQGDARGLDAIGAMAFPEATAAIVELTGHKAPAIAAKAAELLVERLPDNLHPCQASRGAYLADRSWTCDLRKAALGVAWKLLARDDVDSLMRGGRIVQSFGDCQDLPALIKVMDRVLPAYKHRLAEPGSTYLYPAIAVSDTLAEAVGELIRRGAQPPAAAGTPGQAVAFLAGSSSRRPDWQATAEALLKHEIPVIRREVLASMSLPLSEAAAAAVAASLKDDFPPLRETACILAADAKSARFREPLMGVLRTASDGLLLRRAFEAATACGAERDRVLEVLVGRLEPLSNDTNMVVLSLMIEGAIERQGGYGSQAHADWQPFLADMQKAWREFIESNRQALRDGKRFKVGQPPLKREMFPPKFEFYRSGQPPWPEWTDPK